MIIKLPVSTVTSCVCPATVNPAVAVLPAYVFNCMLPSEVAPVSCPPVTITDPPAAAPDAVPAVKFKFPATPFTLPPLSIVKVLVQHY